MTDKITFKDKNGVPKYIADSNGGLKEVGKNGKLRDVVTPKPIQQKPQSKGK